MGRGKGIGVRSPAQYIVIIFLAASFIGALLLMLPMSSQSGKSAPFSTALFTATSAACVTGLNVVDTSTYWSGFGQGVILVLIQLGGLGIMTLTSLLVISLSKKLGLRQQILTVSQTEGLNRTNVKSLILGVIKMTVFLEVCVAIILFLRFSFAHDEEIGRSVYLAVFHAVSAFNNAGFSLFSDSLMSYQADHYILAALAVAIIVGGLGYPVWKQVTTMFIKPSKWDLHAKITVLTTTGLILLGWILFLWFEWSNPATLGQMSTSDSIFNSFFHSVTTRTAGFNTIDIPALNDTSQLLSIILMFIGGGSGSTAGGIKVTTFALLGWVMWAEVRGNKDVTVFKRRVPNDIQRQALTVALMAVGGVVAASMLILTFSPFNVVQSVFESVSALGTAGVSNGITHELPLPSLVVVNILMFMGRVGPPTLFAALVLRNREKLYRYPEERIIIG